MAHRLGSLSGHADRKHTKYGVLQITYFASQQNVFPTLSPPNAPSITQAGCLEGLQAGKTEDGGEEGGWGGGGGRERWVFSAGIIRPGLGVMNEGWPFQRQLILCTSSLHYITYMAKGAAS